jgi:hypothetical protein
LSTTLLHVPGREELALLDVDRLALAGHVLDEIGLAAQERRRLQHVDHAATSASGVSSCTSVSTGTPICSRPPGSQALSMPGRDSSRCEERLALSKEDL